MHLGVCIDADCRLDIDSCRDFTLILSRQQPRQRLHVLLPGGGGGEGNTPMTTACPEGR